METDGEKWRKIEKDGEKWRKIRKIEKNFSPIGTISIIR